MKAFEVEILKNRSMSGGCRRTWPEWWRKVRDRVTVVVYENAVKDVGLAICICDDDIAAEIKAKKDKRVLWSTDAVIDRHGKAWRPQIDKLRDPDKVTLISAKFARGEELTEQELAALDPLNDELGVNRTSEFSIARIRGE